MEKFKRINVVGTSGSGKSTLGKRLAKILGCPFVGLDELFWLPNWQEKPDERFLPDLEKAIDCDSWVLDGNYNRTKEIKWKHVEAVVWIDLPFWLNLKQAVTRAAKRAWGKKEIWPGTGNYETFRKSFFSRDSVVLWTITSYDGIVERYEKDMADPKNSHIKFFRLRSYREIEDFVSKLEAVWRP
ncbi:MAG: hypothetical protein NXH75_04300 [Halobacteriovoraceae bacterium]|nr:hypothetical protein [Halobacteriovoraceae bacterium]